MKIKIIDHEDMKQTKRYLLKQQHAILDMSEQHNLLNKWVTGFGWDNNLVALCNNNCISSKLFNEAMDVIDFFTFVYESRPIPVDT